MTYVVTSGTSMEPTIQDGALILVRQPDEYRVGDIAAFRSPGGNLVLHRIIGRDGATFVMQGDNNAAPDGFQPTEAEMAGELWLHIPAAGHILGGTLWLWALGVASIVALALFVAHRSGHRLPDGAAGVGGHVPSRSWLTPQSAALGFVGLLILGGVSLGLVTFTRPLQTEQTNTVTYVHQGELEYSAMSDPALYPDGLARTNDPVYREHAESVELTFNYNLYADSSMERLSGTARLDLVLRTPDGWASTIPISAPANFEGHGLSVVAGIDFAQVDERLAEMEDVAGLPPNYYDLYELSVMASVSVQGRMGAADVVDDFIARYDFLVDDYVFRPDASLESGEGTALVVRVPGATSTTETASNQIDAGAFTLDLATARTASVATFIAGLSAAVILATGLWLQQRRGRQAAGYAVVEQAERATFQAPAPQGGGNRPARLAPIRLRQSVPTGERSGQDMEGITRSLERISSRLEAHDRNVDIRFDEVLDDIDDLASGLHDVRERASGSDEQREQVFDRRPTLRPIRLRAHIDRRSPQTSPEIDHPDDSSRTGA